MRKTSFLVTKMAGRNLDILAPPADGAGSSSDEALNDPMPDEVQFSPEVNMRPGF
jgi:hypothetical protein